MPADDLMREYELVLLEQYSKFTERVKEAVVAELPSPGQRSKAGLGQRSTIPPYPGVNWATGALKGSVTYTRERLVPGFWYRTVAPTQPYASTYANGDPNIKTYHGYDYISAARRRLGL